MHENIMPEAAGRQKVADGSGDADPQPLRRGIKPQPMPMRLAGGEGEAAIDVWRSLRNAVSMPGSTGA